MHRQVALFAFLMAALGSSHPASADIIYATGFESPTFQNGQPLVGQDDWVAQVYNGDQLGPNAAVISTAHPASGNQSVEVQGADLTPTDAGYAVGSYRKIVDYDVAAAGFPIIRVEADVRIDGPQTEQTPDRFTGDYFSANIIPVIADGYVGELSLSSDGHLYGYSNDDSYLFGVAVAMGQYHHLALDLNFITRTTTYMLNGVVLGTAAFEPSTSNILTRASMVTYAVTPDPLDRDPSAYTAYFDNFSISAVPEPSTFALSAFGLLAIAAPRLRRLRARRRP